VSRDMASAQSTDHRLKAFAWSIFLFCLAVATYGFVVIARSGPGLPSDLAGVDAVTTTAFDMVLPLVGLLIVAHRPRNLVGWLLLAVSLLQGMSSLAGFYATQAVIVDPGSLPFGSVAALGDAAVGVPSLGLFPVLLLVFPTGRLLSPGWRWLAWGCLGAGVATGSVIAIGMWPYRGRELILSATSMPELRTVILMVTAFIVLVLAAGTAALVSLVIRYRNGSRDERLQIKWLALSATLSIAVLALEFVFPSDATWRSVLTTTVVTTIPLSIGVAVLRYRLYEIEVIINRTLVYVPLVAIIGGLATALIPFSQRIFMAVTGNTSDAAIVLTTLFVASFVTPVRKRLEAAVEGRFKAAPSEVTAHQDGNGPILAGPEVAVQLRSLADRIDALERRSKSDPDRAGG
jgi:hypothetical protein